MADYLQPIPRVPSGLREAAQLGKLIPFIGAGASRIAGCPDWAQFADGALKWLIEQGKVNYSQLDQVRNLNPRVKLSLARIWEKEHNVQINFESLLHPNQPRSPKGIQLYRTLFKLGNTFVTTNYDRWLDERLLEPVVSPSAESIPSDTKSVMQMQVIYRVADLLPALLSQPNTVIHLHGSLCAPQEMILTMQDYMRHYANDRQVGDAEKENRVLTFLEHLFKNKTVLFIGYGLEELEILEYVILKARRPTGSPKHESHYMLQGFFSHQEALAKSLTAYYLEHCGIQLIPFLRDYNDWDQLLPVIEEFARALPASVPLVLQKAQEMEDLLND